MAKPKNNDKHQPQHPNGHHDGTNINNNNGVHHSSSSKSSGTVYKNIGTAIRDFLQSTAAAKRSSQHAAPVDTDGAPTSVAARRAIAHRAIITASLSILRSSCCQSVPSQASRAVANTLLAALAAAAKSLRPKPHSSKHSSDNHNGIGVASVANEQISASGSGPRKGGTDRGDASHRELGPAKGDRGAHDLRHQQSPLLSSSTSTSPTDRARGPLELGADCFPEAQVAAFLAEATTPGAERAPPPPRASLPINVSAQLATRVRLFSSPFLSSFFSVTALCPSP